MSLSASRALQEDEIGSTGEAAGTNKDNIRPEEDDDEDSTGSSKEALDLFLGGLDVKLLKEANWDGPTVVADTETQKDKIAAPPRTIHLSTLEPLDESNQQIWNELLTRAHSVGSISGAVQPPSVRIVDLSRFGKGFALVAAQRFPKGQVIWTEKAAVASQIPQAQHRNMGLPPWTNDLFSVRACQQCFRSMEPISCLHGLGTRPLPSPHLWPIAEFSSTIAGNPAMEEEDATKIRTDSNGDAVQCLECRALFCGRFCHDRQVQQFGRCCHSTTAVRTVLEWCQAKHNIHNSFDEQQDGGGEEEPEERASMGEESPEERTAVTIQEPLVLASRMFAMLLHSNRKNATTSSRLTATDGHNLLGCFTGLCGDPSDIIPLEIGEPQGHGYSVQSLYTLLCDNLMVSKEERNYLSLSTFQQLAAVAARNGHNVATRSPFPTYYNALLRQVGRGSEQHTAAKRQVAQALGSTDGELQRTMDRLVEEKCCVRPIVAIFPLTARNNHACDPNAMVRNQEYVDCYIDVVARREIQPGEEITTSYLPMGLSRNRRQRELAAKYLFQCRCESCDCG